MGESSTLNAYPQLCAEGPQLCNVDTQMMPHYRFQAVCTHEGCEETIPFTVGLGRDLRKHYNEKHRLLCKACKRDDFNSKEELEIHLLANHRDGLCFNCHAPFNQASALAMHIGGPKNSCSVPQSALVSALRFILKRQNGGTDPSAVYSPISCSPGGEQIMIQKLKQFRGTLLLAHKKALRDMDDLEIDLPSPPASGTIYLHHGIGYTSPPVYGCYSPDSVLPKSPSACGGNNNNNNNNNNNKNNMSALLRNMSQELVVGRGPDQENWDSLSPKEWTCTTCKDAKFTSLSKLLQHVEAKVRDSWWKSMNNREAG